MTARNQSSGEGWRIALVVDNPFRDLPALLMVARRLCEMGATCYLVPMNLLSREIWPLVPDFVLLNYLRLSNEKTVRLMVEAGIPFGVLDTEGAVYSPAAAGNGGDDVSDETCADLDEYALAMSQDEAVRSAVECCCVWNPRFARHAVRRGWYREEQLAVTGHPRVDLYAPQWRSLSLGISTYAEPFSKDLIVINGSFALANPAFQTVEQEVETLATHLSYDRAYVDQWLRCQETALHGLTALANELAHRLPDATFVYRPHPFESLDRYKGLLAFSPNMHLVRQGTVDGWLLRASALIHWGSSTAIEACLAGIPAFSPGWLPSFPPVPPVDDVSIPCADVAGLERCVKEALDGLYSIPTSVNARIKEVVEQTFHRIDGAAHERVAQTVLAAVARAHTRPNFSKCREFARRPNRALRSRLGRRLRRGLGLPPHWSFQRMRAVHHPMAWDASEKCFNTVHVRALVEVINSCAATDGVARDSEMGVASALERRDYRIEQTMGRTITVYPRSRTK